MTVAEIIKIKILAHLKQQQLAVDSLQHESARLEEENCSLQRSLGILTAFF